MVPQATPKLLVERSPPAASEHKRRGPSVSSGSEESVPANMRRQFTAPEKPRLVKGAEVALASGERGTREALLRKEGSYSS